MKKCLLLALVALAYLPLRAQQTLFSQDFSTSTVLSDYVNATSPSATQFTFAGTGPKSSVRIVDTLNYRAISFLKTVSAAGTGSIVRTALYPANSNPSVLFFSFDLQLANTGAAQQSALSIYIGGTVASYLNDTTQQNTADAFVKLGINTVTAGSDTFILRDNSSTSLNSTLKFNGKKTITIIANNMNSTYTYNAPDGTSETVGPGAWDVYVGITRVFNDRVAAGTTSLNAFKIVNSTASRPLAAYFSNFLVTDNVTVLPITLGDFGAREAGNGIKLNWNTTSEVNNHHFVIYHSIDGTNFSELAQIKGLNKPSDYEFTHAQPFKGNNFYKLVQVDMDGKKVEVATRMVKYNQQNSKLISFYPNPTRGAIKIHLATSLQENVSIQIVDLSGRMIQQETIATNGYTTHILQLNSSITPGNYLVKVVSKAQVYTERLVVQ